jgi:hypothetical protein
VVYCCERVLEQTIQCLEVVRNKVNNSKPTREKGSKVRIDKRERDKGGTGEISRNACACKYNKGKRMDDDGAQRGLSRVVGVSLEPEKQPELGAALPEQAHTETSTDSSEGTTREKQQGG